MNNTFKKNVVAKVEVPKYSPVELVKRYGDAWTLGLPAAMNTYMRLALRSTTPDFYDYCTMTMMEKGIVGRIQS